MNLVYHPHFTVQEGKAIQEHAYLRDFHELGPSPLRAIEKNMKDGKIFIVLKNHISDQSAFLVSTAQTT
jgi:hypothetical protein